MTKTTLFLWGVAVCAAPCCGQGAKTQPRRDVVRFESTTRRGVDDTPHTNVFLRANGRRTLVLRTVGGFEPIPRADFAGRGIPRGALAACSLWWAGAGDNLYVVRHGGRFDVFRQELDEQADTPPFHRWKSVLAAPKAR